MIRERFTGLAFAGCLILVACGCGSDRGTVKGRVLVNGAPLKAGNISFLPVDPKQGQDVGAVITDGDYQIDAAKGALAGEYQVKVTAMRKTGRKTWDGMGDENAPPSKKRYVEELEQFIPPEYNETTKLRTTIKAGEVNVYDVDVKIDGKK